MVGDHEIQPDGGEPDASIARLDGDAVRSLNDLVGDDPELIAELVDAFLEEAPIRLGELRTGLREGDPVLAGRAAHTLKSNGYTFGALALGDLCRELETAARNGDLSAAAPLVEQVDAEWSRVRSALDELREASS